MSNSRHANIVKIVDVTVGSATLSEKNVAANCLTAGELTREEDHEEDQSRRVLGMITLRRGLLARVQPVLLDADLLRLKTVQQPCSQRHHQNQDNRCGDDKEETRVQINLRDAVERRYFEHVHVERRQAFHQRFQIVASRAGKFQRRCHPTMPLSNARVVTRCGKRIAYLGIGR